MDGYSWIMLMRMLYSVAKCVVKRNKNKKGNKINHKGILAALRSKNMAESRSI